MKLAELYRAARRNLWRLSWDSEKGMRPAWKGTPNYPHAQARWKHTALARERVKWYLASMMGKLGAVHEVDKVLAAHWMEFKPRTRCISRMLRDLLGSKDRHVLKSA